MNDTDLDAKNMELAGHAMLLAIFKSIIGVMEAKNILSSWDLTENLSLINTSQLSSYEKMGLEWAQKWVYENFTTYANPR